MIVATVRALKMHGGAPRPTSHHEDVAAVTRGAVNLARHIDNVRNFGVPVVVAINHFAGDTEDEIAALQAAAAAHGVEAIVCRHWAEGGAGAIELAEAVAALAEAAGAVRAALPRRACRCSRRSRRSPPASTARAASPPRPRSTPSSPRWEAAGYGHLPVCMAKTQVQFLDRSHPARCARRPRRRRP